MATHSSIHASEIPWTEKPGGHSPWSLKESEMNEQLAIYPCCSMYESLVPFQNLCPTALKTGGKSGPPLPSSPLQTHLLYLCVSTCSWSFRLDFPDMEPMIIKIVAAQIFNFQYSWPTADGAELLAYVWELCREGSPTFLSSLAYSRASTVWS